MYTIKKYCILVSIILFSLAPLSADETPGRYSFSITPLTGLLVGQSEEIVYKHSGSDKYLSQLLWDVKPLVYLGVAADFGPRDPFQGNGFISATSIKFGLPFKTGIMEDRDWKYPDNQNLTNFSRHDAYAEKLNILTDLSAGYSWRLKDYLAINAFGEFSYMRFSWVARDGYYQYLTSDSYGNINPGQTWNANTTPKVKIHGDGIRYVQNWLILAPGVSLKGRFNKLFSLEGNFCYSPLIYCADRDDHLVRNLIFWDYLYFGNYINAGGAFTFSPKSNLDLSLAVSYRYISGARGKTFQEDTKNTPGQIFQSINDAGAGYSVLDIELAVKIRLYGKLE